MKRKTSFPLVFHSFFVPPHPNSHLRTMENHKKPLLGLPLTELKKLRQRVWFSLKFCTFATRKRQSIWNTTNLKNSSLPRECRNTLQPVITTHDEKSQKICNIRKLCISLQRWFPAASEFQAVGSVFLYSTVNFSKSLVLLLLFFVTLRQKLWSTSSRHKKQMFV